MKSVAVVTETGRLPEANAVAFAKAARNAGMTVTAEETLAPGTSDFAPLFDKLKAGAPDLLLVMPGSLTTDFSAPMRRPAGRCRSADGWTSWRLWPRFRPGSGRRAA